MSSQSNDTIQKTLVVALLLCIVCSVVVSAAAVLLKPTQVRNKNLDVKENILVAAGLLQKGASSDTIEAKFAEISPRLVDLDTGRFVEPGELGLEDVQDYDQKKASKDPSLSKDLGSQEDIAGINRREKYAKVYLLEKDGELEKVILPVHGYGLWSTLYGFLALEGDLNTVAGLGFYQHAETPGLGGEVDNPNWKALWEGKAVYSEGAEEPAIEVVKGSVDTSRDGAEHKVDGLSGATLTSRGVTNLLQYWLGQNGFKPFLTNLKTGDV